MALSRIAKNGDGSTTTFAVNFALDYISEADVTCRVGAEVDGSGNPVYRTITFLSTNLLQISGTAPPVGVGNVVFERTVDKSALEVNFDDGDNLTEQNLDTAQKQAMMAVHEVLDGRIGPVAQDIDMDGHTLKNLGDPSDASDPATKSYVDDANALKLGRTGSPWDAEGRVITNVAAPTANTDATTQGHVAEHTAYDYGDGTLNATTRRITNVGSPVNDSDVATKGWSNDAAASTLAAAIAAKDIAVAAAGSNLVLFNKKSTALAATIPTATDYLFLAGRDAAGDGGGGLYEVQATEPANPILKFQLANGRWARNADKVFNVEKFGINPSNPDCAQGFADLCSEIVWNGGGRIEFPDNKELLFFSTNASVDGEAWLMNLHDVKGVRINGNGCKLRTAHNPHDGAGLGHDVFTRGIVLKEVTDVEINDLWIANTAFPARDYTAGITGIYVVDRVESLRINGFKQSSGTAALVAQGTSTTLADTSRSKAQSFVDITTDEVFYGIDLDANIDHLRGIIRTKHAGRSYLVVRVKDHDLTVISDHSDGFNDVVVGVNGDPSANIGVNRTEDITIRYINRPDPAYAGSTSKISVNFQSTGLPTTPVAVRNLKFDVDIDVTGMATDGPALLISSNSAASNGSIIDGIELSGRVAGYASGSSLVDVATDRDWSAGTPDIIANLKFKNLRVDNSVAQNITIDGRPFNTAPVVFEDVVAPSVTIVPQNFPSNGLLDFSRNVYTASHVSFASGGGSGHEYLANGGLKQWGMVAVAAGTSQTVTFPIPFRFAPSRMVCLADTGADGVVTADTSSTQITVGRTGGTGTNNVQWEATGLI